MKSCKKKKNRRHFQLLEVLVAIFLLIVCAVPALQIFTRIFEEQAGAVRTNEKDHLVHLMHAKLVEQLYKRTISFQEITGKKQEKYEDPALKKELERLQLEASYALNWKEPASEKKQLEASELIGELTIKLNDKVKKEESKYTYLFYAARQERGAKSPKNKTEKENEREDEEDD